MRISKVGGPVGIESRFGWLLNGPVPKQQSVSTNLSFANESSSHVLFCNAQNSVGNHLDMELHHLDKELHRLDKELHRLDKELHHLDKELHHLDKELHHLDKELHHLDKELHHLDKELHCFGDLESLGISEVEKSPFEDFSDTIYLNKERRYEANLPFKKPHPLLHDHFNLCDKRLPKLYSALKQDTVLLKMHNDIFLNQMKLGIIEPANENVSPGKFHYIPHHPVVGEDKNTSKVRIVFDASGKSDGPSLNKCLYKGPELTPPF